MGFTSVPFKNTVLLAKSVSIRWLSVRHYLSWRQKMRVVLEAVNDLEKSVFAAFSVDNEQWQTYEISDSGDAISASGRMGIQQ